MKDSENSYRQKHSDKKRKKRKRRKKRSIIGTFFRIIFILIIIVCFAVGGAALGAVIGVMESTSPINTADVVPESYTSVIYDTKGNEIDRLHGDENREYVKLDAIPLDLQRAVVAIEDERFYEHNGIDIRGIGRAMVTNLKSGNFSQGASTITQQLIKNEVLTSEKKIQRKIKEQYLAITMEKNLEKQLGSKKKAKDYILELYMNSISLNHGLNGVQAAAKFYYGKDVVDLTLAECASIAGITKNPSLYSPISNREESKKRQLTVLTKMKDVGYITESQYNEAAAEDIYSKIVGSTVEDTDGSNHNYFVDALIVQIAEDLQAQKDMTKSQAYDMIYSSGLKINATVDSNMQATLETSFQDDSLFPPRGNTFDVNYTISVLNTATQEQEHHSETTTVTDPETEVGPFVESMKAKYLDATHTLVLDKVTTTSSLQSAMVIMDFHNGEVKALIGGRGEKPGDLVFNRATQAYRQPGSCFKPLAGYAPAIDTGLLMPGSVIVDEPFSVGSYKPENWTGRFEGPKTVREGIRDSMNVLAVKTLMMVGFDKSFEYLHNFGFTNLKNDPNEDQGPSMVLGGLKHGVTVLDLTAAYSAIANGGVYHKPKFYTTVYDHNGKELLVNDQEPKRVLKETTAYMLTDMMKDVIVGGGNATGRLANFTDYKMTIAGKTGTTSDDKDLMFAGYTPYYCAGIWLGYDNPKPIRYDKSYHLLMWRDVMQKIHNGLANKDFPRPSGIETISFCNISGLAPKSSCSSHSDLAASDFTMETCSSHRYGGGGSGNDDDDEKPRNTEETGGTTEVEEEPIGSEEGSNGSDTTPPKNTDIPNVPVAPPPSTNVPEVPVAPLPVDPPSEPSTPVAPPEAPVEDVPIGATPSEDVNDGLFDVPAGAE